MNTNWNFSDVPTPIAIVGLGITGHAIEALLLAGGVKREQVITFDHKSPEAQYKIEQDLMEIAQPKTLVVSPGVPLTSPWILEAKKKGLLITSELRLAHRFLTTEKLVAITGSLGKSTTTCLLRAGLEKFCSHYFVGGNLGIPLATYALNLLEGRCAKAEWVVLELSSYQLENFPELKPEFSIVTYFTSNHLERYESKYDYYQTKWNLVDKTKQAIILNLNGGELHEWAQSHPSNVPTYWTDKNSELMKSLNLSQCQLIGSHNLDNISMAAQLIALAQWPKTAYQGLLEFPGLPHRVENLGWFHEIRWINDSKSTTMDSVKTAVYSTLESVPTTKTLHLLLGGRDKNLPWHNLSEFNEIPNLKIYFFGESRILAQKQSGLKGSSFPTLNSACDFVYNEALEGDSVLLSPGGTSLDEFKNFEERGEHFRAFCHSKGSP